MVEQWTHKPLDVGSNPTLATQLLTFLTVCSNTRRGTCPTLATQLLTFLIVCSNTRRGTRPTLATYYLLKCHWMWVYR